MSDLPLPPMPFRLLQSEEAAVRGWGRAIQEAERAMVNDELERFRNGHQGSCYACEPVGVLNQKLEAERATDWNAAIEAAACEAEAHYIPGHSVAGPGFAQAGAKAIRELKR